MVTNFHKEKREVSVFFWLLRFSTFVICHLVRIARLGINKEELIIKESRDGLRELEYMWGGRVCLPICLTKSPQRLRIMNCDVKILSKFKEMRRKQTAPPLPDIWSKNKIDRFTSSTYYWLWLMSLLFLFFSTTKDFCNTLPTYTSFKLTAVVAYWSWTFTHTVL